MRIDLVRLLEELQVNVGLARIMLGDYRFYNFVNPINLLSYIEGFRDYLLKIRTDNYINKR